MSRLLASATFAAFTMGGCAVPSDMGTVTVSGTWALGPAAGGEVSVLTLDARENQNGHLQVPVVVAADDGTFSVAVELEADGDFRLCVRPGAGAAYREVGAGTRAALKTDVCVNLIDLRRDETARKVVVTAATSLASALTDSGIDRGLSVSKAAEVASATVEGWLDCLSTGHLLGSLPYLPGPGSQAPEPGPALLLYALGGGLGDLAVEISRQLGAAPGILIVNSSDILASFVADLHDGIFDDVGPHGVVGLHDGYPWTVQTWPGDLIRSIHRFMLSEHNDTGVNPEALLPHLQCLGVSTVFGANAHRIEQPSRPTVQIASPHESDVITGRQEVSVDVEAKSPVDAVHVTVFDGKTETELVTTVEHSDEGASASAALRATDYPDGSALRLKARARTSIGYWAEHEIRILVNSAAPALSLYVDGVPVDDLEGPVQGEIALRGEADDISGIDSITLTVPGQDAVAGRDGVVEMTADTTRLPEGKNTFVLAATDGLGEAGSISPVLVVDNQSEGQAEVNVSLGAPVRDALVTVKELPSGQELGRARTDEHGRAMVTLSDPSAGYGGYVDYRVTDGVTQDLIDGGELPLRRSDVLRTIVRYEPTSNGTVVAGLQVNAVTTCAAELVDRYVAAAKHEYLADSVDQAYWLFGDHLSRANSPEGLLDSRRVAPSDMTGDWSRDAPLRRRLGLMHSGLAWDATAHAWRAGRDHREYTILDHIDRLCRGDLGSQRFSGRDEDGETVVTVGSEQLNGDSFRYDLALGMFGWMDGVLPDGSAFEANQTSLRGADFAQIGGTPDRPETWGFLHVVAGTQNELFGADAPAQRFDVQPPTLIVSTPATKVNNALVPLKIVASDPDGGTGIARLTIVIDGGTLVEIPVGSSVDLEQSVQIPCNREDVGVTVTVYDGVGLYESASLSFDCDDLKPTGRWMQSSYRLETFLDAQLPSGASTIVYVWLGEGHYDMIREGDESGFPAVIIKYWDRLYVDSDNVPVLKYWVSDAAEGGFFTADADLKVSYEYLRQRYDQEEIETLRGKTELPYPGNGQHYEIPISYETLSPELRTSYVGDRNLIRVTARDALGNEDVIDYDFHVFLLSAPVWYRDCSMADALAMRDLESDLTHEVTLGDLRIGEGKVIFPPRSDVLNGRPLHVRIAEAPSLSMRPSELRWERGLYPRRTFTAPFLCTSDDFHVFWTLDRQSRSAAQCDSDHWGTGPLVNTVVGEEGPYGYLYRGFVLEASPTAAFYDASGVRLPQDETDASTFLLPPSTNEATLRAQSGGAQTYLAGAPYAWDEYELTAGDGSDISTRRYYFAGNYINITNTREGWTKSEGANIYLSKLRVQVGLPRLEVAHPELPHVDIPVEVDASCESVAEEWEERIGERW